MRQWFKAFPSLCFAAGLLLAACQFQPVPSLNPSSPYFKLPQQTLRSQRTALADGMSVYYGNMHSHTDYSDGILNPREAYKMAIGNGLDFMAITEHNHDQAAGNDGVYLTPELYEDLKRTAAEFTQPGKFAALYGQEVSTISKGNHVNIFEADSIVDIPHGDFKRLYEEWLPAHPEVAFVQFNHPAFRRDLGLPPKAESPVSRMMEAQFHQQERLASNRSGPDDQLSDRFNDYGYDDYGQNFAALAKAANPWVKTIEILNGPGTSPKPLPKVEAFHEEDFFFYLNQGFKLAPTADQDNHYAHWGNLSPARTGVLAPSLTKADIYAAFRAQRIFATEDQNLSLIMKVNGHYMGESFTANPQLNFEIDIQDGDEPQALYLLQIYADVIGDEMAKPVLQKQLAPGENRVQIPWQAFSAPEIYALAKIVQTNANGSFDEAWTAPVWIRF